MWGLSDGKAVQKNGEVTADWNEAGARWAQSMLQNGTNRYERIDACRYLLYSHRSEDRTSLLQALAARDVSPWHGVKLNADRALAIWDGEATNFLDLDFGVQTEHHMLGAVEVILRLPDLAAEGEVYLMLFPATVKESDWRQATPELRGGRSFRMLYDQPATNEVHLPIDPVLPGKYWLKAIWDRKAPFTHDLWGSDGFQAWRTRTNNDIAYGKGDAESGTRRIFEVKAKESVRVTLDCATIE